MNRVLSVITPNGTALAEWAAQFGGAPGFVASNWLQEWGLDLSRFESDREARNTASYRPALDSPRGPRAIRETLQAIDELWTLCDPGGVGGFPYLDRHLLREVLVELFESGGDSRKHLGWQGEVRATRRANARRDQYWAFAWRDREGPELSRGCEKVSAPDRRKWNEGGGSC